MGKMSKVPVHTTVRELIAGLFDETRHLHWLKRREKQLLVALHLFQVTCTFKFQL
jgi:hypothetical protein